jgi:hypothetical protein
MRMCPTYRTVILSPGPQALRHTLDGKRISYRSVQSIELREEQS